ncbi:hypothetical protein AMK26_07740 [Streptomyces sp. CB03234]|uniref:hypothetical protein n=1 Tax=Streptomyces sp. (strain CB03234) TaxID=1703937 RepID=UPI00093A3B7F|nr:hypothetical protein [Streptomyces sp. CB03234]OKK05977.1 hypothetical protein AMK26_07740 [Streptomyces sp. CB03234]
MSFGGPQWPQEPHHSHQQQPYAPPQTGAPDWSALAEASERRTRRKRLLIAGGAVLATALVGTIIATAIVSTNKADDDGANLADTTSGAPELPTDTAKPQPSFSSVAPPPPPNPMDFISTAQKDKAPISAGSLFPGKKLTMGDRVHIKGATASTTTCAAAAEDGLGAVLERNGCERVIRATYERDGVAVTVGVALFENQAAAVKAKEQAQGGIAPLVGSGVNGFCQAKTVCLRRANSLGRYAYFTQAGFTSGKKVTKADEIVFKVSDDVGTFAFNQIYARGRAQASAAATAPATGGQ